VVEPSSRTTATTAMATNQFHVYVQSYLIAMHAKYRSAKKKPHHALLCQQHRIATAQHKQTRHSTIPIYPMRGRTSLSRDFAPCPARLQCFTFVPPRHVMPAADIRPSASVCYAATLLCCYGATVLHAQLPHRTIRNQNLGWALWDIPRADWKRPLHLSSIGK
jgi:hypothetical protein